MNGSRIFTPILVGSGVWGLQGALRRRCGDRRHYFSMSSLPYPPQVYATIPSGERAAHASALQGSRSTIHCNQEDTHGGHLPHKANNRYLLCHKNRSSHHRGGAPSVSRVPSQPGTMAGFANLRSLFYQLFSRPFAMMLSGYGPCWVQSPRRFRQY
jgi:hypothetical protein